MSQVPYPPAGSRTGQAMYPGIYTLYHAIEHTANQITGKLLYIQDHHTSVLIQDSLYMKLHMHCT